MDKLISKHIKKIENISKVLVSLFSEQTIPNVEIIKEFQNKVDDFFLLKKNYLIK